MKAEERLLRRILVVANDEDMRENLRRILLGAGYEVSLAEDGTQAITVLRTQPCHPVRKGEVIFRFLDSVDSVP